MSALPNPFTPGFGQVPYRLAGRGQIVDEVTRAFDLTYRDPSLTSIFVGARGTGKTALLTYLSAEAQQHGWIVVDAVAREGMLEDIFQRSAEAASEFIDSSAHKRLRALSVSGVGSVEWETDATPQKNWRGKMTKLLDELAQKDLGLLITVDEIDPTLTEVAELISTYQLFVREERRVSLLLAGLPGKVLSLMGRPDISFIRRAKRYGLGPIPSSEVMTAFAETVAVGGRSIGDEALRTAVDAIGGFAFMMQAVGYRVWDQGDATEITTEDVQSGILVARQELVDGVLQSTYYELGKSGREFVAAMLQDSAESSIANIIERTGKSSNSVQKTRRKLMDLGVIGERGRGYVDFELPYFRDYLQERLG